MRSYGLSREAGQDLDGIAQYLFEDSPSAATRVTRELWESFERLNEFPHLGHSRPDLTEKPVLFWQVFSYLVIYRVHDERLQVVRVLHSSRDIPNLLDP